MRRSRKHPVWIREAAPAATRQRPLPLPAGESPSVRQPSPATDLRRLWFCVYLPNLPLETGAGAERPCAVVEDCRGMPRVLLANRKASAAGIEPGQSPNAALALLPELELVERSVLEEQRTLESLAVWLEQYSSFVSLAGRDVLLLEIAGSLRLFGGLRRLRQQVSDGLDRLGFDAALAIAPTPLAATWLARGGRRVCIRDPENLVARIRDLPLDCLDWPSSVVESLIGVGVRTVGDCLRLPRAGFAQRFGAGRLLELDRAIGRLPDPRDSWRAPEHFLADYDLDEEQSDRQLLLSICEELLAAHERFLLRRQLGSRQLRFCFYHLKAGATQLVLGRSGAERSAAGWSDLLALRFERLQLPEAVIAIRLEGGRTEALETGSGRLEFDGRKSAPGGYSMTRLAERLAARIGETSVNGVTTVAEHRPQLAWRTWNPSAAGTRGGAIAPAQDGKRRPLWLLPEPAPLAAGEDDRPHYFGPLTLLDGPERLETGWWDDEGIARDYYTATNRQGMRLWVFRCRDTGAAWFLHGIFG